MRLVSVFHSMVVSTGNRERRKVLIRGVQMSKGYFRLPCSRIIGICILYASQLKAHAISIQILLRFGMTLFRGQDYYSRADTCNFTHLGTPNQLGTACFFIPLFLHRATDYFFYVLPYKTSFRNKMVFR